MCRLNEISWERMGAKCSPKYHLLPAVGCHEDFSYSNLHFMLKFHSEIRLICTPISPNDDNLMQLWTQNYSESLAVASIHCVNAKSLAQTRKKEWYPTKGAHNGLTLFFCLWKARWINNSRQHPAVSLPWRPHTHTHALFDLSACWETLFGQPWGGAARLISLQQNTGANRAARRGPLIGRGREFYHLSGWERHSIITPHQGNSSWQ